MYSPGGLGGAPRCTNPFLTTCGPAAQQPRSTNPFLCQTGRNAASYRPSRSASCPRPSGAGNKETVALQSIAVALSRMQEVMATMKTKTEQTDATIACVSSKLQSHAQVMRRLDKKIRRHERKNQLKQDLLREQEKRYACASPYPLRPQSSCVFVPDQSICPGCHSLVPPEDQNDCLSMDALKAALTKLNSCPRCHFRNVSPKSPCYCSPRAQRLGKKLFKAIREKRPRYIEGLLAKGADPNYSAPDKWTPLHRAAARGNVRVMKALLNKGAHVGARTHCGLAPLHVAAYHDDTGRMVVMLLDSGADVSARNEVGRSALHYAAKIGNIAAIRALTAAGARETALDNVGRLPLCYAKSRRIRRMLRRYKHAWPLTPCPIAT